MDLSGYRRECSNDSSLARAKRLSKLEMHRVVGELAEAEQTFDLGNEVRQFLRKFRIQRGSLDKAQQFFTHQISQRVANSKMLLYALRGLALFNPSPMKFYS
jgi:hypothetical protein